MIEALLTADQNMHLLRRLGDLTPDEVVARSEGGAAVADRWLEELVRTRVAALVRIASEGRWIAMEDVARYRDGIGVQATGRGAKRVPRTGRQRARRAARPLGTDARPRSRRTSRHVGVDAAAGRGGCTRTAARCGQCDPAGEFRPGGAEREWCDRCAAACSAGGSPRACGAKSSPWIPPRSPGSSPTGMASRPWGAASPRSVAPLPLSASRRSWTSSRASPSRHRFSSVTFSRPASPGYQPRLLDELGSLGEVGWVGRGSLGRDDGRTPDSPGSRGAPAGRASTRLSVPRLAPRRDPRAPYRRGASFYREIYSAAGGGTDRDVLDALWDLVWAGEVTNDTFAAGALRGATGRDRARPGCSTALGPLEAAGRWSLVEPPTASPTERLHAQSLALLERHGVLTREAVVGEGIEGGFSAVYLVPAPEEAGRIRRGYFVDGLGAAQFALAGALDRLRAVREPSDADPLTRTAHVLLAADPANPFGAALPWSCRGEDEIAGPSNVPRARTWRWSMATRPCTSSVAARPSRRWYRPTTRRSPRRRCAPCTCSSPTAASASSS